jgi:hypothetical protein
MQINATKYDAASKLVFLELRRRSCVFAGLHAACLA